MVLCDAGPTGGSAYLATGAGGSSLSPEDLGHQLAGFNVALPNPQALICQEGAGQAGRGGKPVPGPTSKSQAWFCVCSCMWPECQCVTLDLLLSDPVFMCRCVSLCHMWACMSMPCACL